MNRLRISIGNASCKNFSSNDVALSKACSVVLEKIDYLKKLNRAQLEKWKEAETEILKIDRREILLTVFLEHLKADNSLVVVQAFCPTWKSPNYFSLTGVGRIFSEGFFIGGNDQIVDAFDDDLWAYR